MPLGRYFNIPVRLHFTFFLLLAVQVLGAIPTGKWWVLCWFIVLGPVLLATIVVHEMGHSLAARCVGGEALGIMLWPLGGLAFIHHNASPKGAALFWQLLACVGWPRNAATSDKYWGGGGRMEGGRQATAHPSRGGGARPTRLDHHNSTTNRPQQNTQNALKRTKTADMWVAFAGPLTHIPMTGAWLLASLAATKAAYGRAFLTLSVPYRLNSTNLGVAVVSLAIILNISLFVFNLFVPAYPLDGGRILVDALLSCRVPIPTTAKVTAAVAALCATGLLVYGAWTVQITMILISAFIFFSVWQLVDATRKGALDSHPLFAFTANQQQQQASRLEAGWGAPAGAPQAGGAYVPPTTPAAAYPPAYPQPQPPRT